MSSRPYQAYTKNAPDWLTRAIFRNLSRIMLRPMFPVNLGTARDLERYSRTKQSLDAPLKVR